MIDERAIIDPTAKIADNVEIGPWSIIGAGVEIGEGTWIGPHVVIKGPTKIGRNNKIYQFASVGEAPQDKKYNNEDTWLEIGDNNIIREFTTINRGTVQGGNITKIGNDNLLMAYVHVAHDCIVGNNCILANCVNLAGHVVLGDFVIIEGVAGVQQFVHIGEHAFIASGVNARKNIPPYVKAARDPLTYAGVNSVGLRRRGFSTETILQIEDIYRSLYVRGLNVTNAVSVIEQEAPKSKEKDIILNFIKESTKGIIRGPLV